MNDKLAYLIGATGKVLRGAGAECPNCGARDALTVDRKYLVTSLVRCADCSLLFRRPATTPEESAAFYQTAYQQGFTTEMPTDAQLQEYLRTNFEHPEKNYQHYVDIVCAAAGAARGRLFELGCSWGYGSYQFGRAGFDVEAYEVSQPRAEFARTKLGVRTHTSLDTVQGPFDIFFSSHVLEHVPSVSAAIGRAFDVLAPGGIFIAVTPNGSLAHRQAQPESWHKLWGRVHPNFLDDEYYRRALAGKVMYLASPPYDLERISRWAAGGASETADLSGGDLLVIARKPG